MFLELVIAILLGCLLGTLTGITPGLHINLVSVMILSVIPLFLTKFSLPAVAAIIISMSITHTFTDFLPSIFLGAASDDTALSVLPGHRMLMAGKSLLAVRLSVIGGILSVLLSIVLLPIFLLATATIYQFLQPSIGYILVLVSLLLILRQGEKNKIFWSATVFFLSGILGLIVLNSNFREPLLPMLSGIFGVSTLLYSMNESARIPPQHRAHERIPLSDIASPSILGSIASIIVSIFPAVGPAHAAIISSQFTKKISERGYLVMMGAINTASMLFSLVTLYTIGKARNGSIIAVQKMFPSITLQQFFLFFLVAAIAAAIASFITIELAGLFAEKISDVNYAAISLGVILLVVLLVTIFSGFVGLLILLIGSAIGLIPNIMKVERTSAMGCLLLPVIAYFLL